MNCRRDAMMIDWNSELTELRKRWLDGGDGDGCGVSAGSVVVEGDFAGIQNFVLKPVPGFGGAAKRLRARSLRVLALTQLIAKRVERALPGGRLLYTAGGRFLARGDHSLDWTEQLGRLQRDLDEWLLRQFRGEVVFHLAGTECAAPRIPYEALREALRSRRAQPLSHALRGSDGWNESAFYAAAQPGAIVCRGCGATAARITEHDSDEVLCLRCEHDTRLGARLAHLDRPCLVPLDGGEIEFFDTAYGLASETGDREEVLLPVVHWNPRTRSGETADFDALADECCGRRKYLGYLRMDADRVGEEFHRLGGAPGRVRALSRLLQRFFCDRVQDLICRDFPSIYPVYGGGDDLFVVGPWDRTLSFALRVAEEFEFATSGGLSLSAGFALAKPREHVLTKSDEAEQTLMNRAKPNKPRIAALGAVADWNTFRSLLETAKRLASWHDSRDLSSAFLQDLFGLYDSEKASAGTRTPPARFRPLLHYQIERNLKGPVRDWARAQLSKAGQWEWMGFLVQYAMLASKEEPERKE